MSSTLEGLEKIRKLKLNKDWVYAGGDEGSHLNYWNIFNKKHNFERPKHKENCVCNQEIYYNCWIVNLKKKKVKTIGNECILKFVDYKRTCEICKEPHRNSKNNRCNECRIKYCITCDKKKNNKYDECSKCKFKKEPKNGFCLLCNKDINSKFNYCYTCNIERKKKPKLIFYQ